MDSPTNNTSIQSVSGAKAFRADDLATSPWHSQQVSKELSTGMGGQWDTHGGR